MKLEDEEVTWCMNKIAHALSDYNISDAKNYLEILRICLE